MIFERHLGSSSPSRSRFADRINNNAFIGFVLAIGMIGLFAALPLFVGDFFLILPGFWP